MGYNICIIQPDGYAHSLAFLELGELICYGLQDIGCAAGLSSNYIDPNRINVLIGCHLLPPALADEVPPSTIVLNTEQVGGMRDDLQSALQGWVARFETWDYSDRNVEMLAALTGRRPKFLRLGYHPRLDRIPRAPIQDLDVLFYGSRNARRREVLKAIAGAGLRVEAPFGVYGDSRDALIARAKIVLNMHFFDTKLLEVVRLFYLMTNRKAVVCEVEPETHVDERYRPGLATTPYDGLVERCHKLVADEGERALLEEQASTTIRAMPQGPIMAELIGLAGIAG